MGIAVQVIDPRDDVAFDEWFAVLHVTDKERWPDKDGWHRAERLAWALDEDGPEEHRCLVAKADDTRTLGIGDLEMFRRENLHLARLDVRVLPECRRRGIGRAIVRAAAELAEAAGRSELGGMDEVPVRPGFVNVSAPFALRLGFADALHMVRRDLSLPFSPATAERLRRRATPEGYATVTFTDRWPDAFMADRCELGLRMSTDAPVGDQELDEEVWDEARVRHVEAQLDAMGRTRITTAAVHQATGHIVAFTEIVIPRSAPESVWQTDTLVMSEHRGHGLGLLMKVVNAAAVMEAFPAVRTVSTWNAAMNQHMIAINDELGFEVVANSAYWLTDIERLSLD